MNSMLARTARIDRESRASSAFLTRHQLSLAGRGEHATRSFVGFFDDAVFITSGKAAVTQKNASIHHGEGRSAASACHQKASDRIGYPARVVDPLELNAARRLEPAPRARYRCAPE